MQHIHTSPQALPGSTQAACPCGLSKSTYNQAGEHGFNFILICVYNSSRMEDAHYKWVDRTTDPQQESPNTDF